MTAYEMRISDWSSDVCSSDLVVYPRGVRLVFLHPVRYSETANDAAKLAGAILIRLLGTGRVADGALARLHAASPNRSAGRVPFGVSATKCPDSRSEEHTSELQSLMRISYAVFCLKKKKTQTYMHKLSTEMHE